MSIHHLVIKNQYMPLSWEQRQEGNDKFTVVPLKRNVFIPFAQISSKNAQTLSNTISINYKKFFLRGCNYELLKDLANETEVEAFQVGSVANINLDRFQASKSLLELKIRAAKKVVISRETTIPFKDSSSKPILKNLFHDQLKTGQLLFVARNISDNNPVAFITISKQSKYVWHLENISRGKSAAIGCIELLILHAIALAKESGCEIFSLGEVPFISKDSKEQLVYPNKSVKLHFYRKLIMLSAPLIKGSYNYEGLFEFKNKFSPEWSAVYCVAKNKINLSDLISLALKTNTAQLLLYNLGGFLRRCYCLKPRS